MNIVVVPLLFNYIDRSWAMGVEIFVLFSASNPNSGIRADLCMVVLVRLECIMDAGVDFLIVTLLFASAHVCGILGSQSLIASGTRLILCVLCYRLMAPENKLLAYG
jgi:hypothetical protein